MRSKTKYWPTTQNDLKTYKFKSKILLDGSIFSPDSIVVRDSQVIYKKRNKYLIGTDESSIPFSRQSHGYRV